MSHHVLKLGGHALEARADGSLFWPAAGLLCVSDLHLGKSERIARRGGGLLPPYETRETLARLDNAIAATAPRHVICLGDSFDDLDAATDLPEDMRLHLSRLQAGRDWTWIEGNHDPGPVALGGSHLAELVLDGLHFRHIATPDRPEVSGHYHPKARVPVAGARPCFLVDENRVILPAFGAYTGGLRVTEPILRERMAADAIAVLTGRRAVAVPLAAL
jgi:DNA ligase-associated metallophosphoesterase